jgi:alginate O-acetyltransferase complex protein AlgI
LVAGPIEKAGDLIPQFKLEAKLTQVNFSEGAKMLLWGFFKKIVIADTLGVYCIRVFGDVYNPQWSAVDYWIALPVFAYYLYCDFSGYCDIAIGSARWFNIKLTNNFNKPFSSLNFRVFWNRWHITLSRWVKDYVFLPLGGIRGGTRIQILFSVLVSFAIVGVWHGASSNFLLFGLTAGLYVVIDYSTKDIRIKIFSILGLIKYEALYKFFCRLATFMLFCSLAIFYCLENLDETNYYLHHLFVFSKNPYLNMSGLVIMTGLILVVELAHTITPKNAHNPFSGIKNNFLRISTYSVMIFCIMILANRGGEVFHYFQF